jgi:alpha-L-arabinofuranosidase
MRRRTSLAVMAALAGGLGCRPPAHGEVAQQARKLPSTGRHLFSVTIDAADAGTPVNRMLFGQNIHWVDGGDGLVERSGAFRAEMLAKVKALHPTTMRFPGGAQSDVYHWKAGIGAVATRGENQHFHSGKMQPSVLGTQEFLELCEMTAAVPFITVNVVTGTAQEAAAWLRHTNVEGMTSRVTGRRLPAVPYWEIGNEPYLQEGDKKLWLTPKMFVERANSFIRALRAVDPAIRIGVPMRTPKVSGLQATPYPTFAEEVLRGVSERFDFLSQHNAYMPYAFDGVPDDDTLYWATMGSSATVQRNLQETRDMVSALRPGKPLPQAITEFNALFTLGKGNSDTFIASPLGALYVADLIRMLAGEDDILLAHYWSIAGNWMFGSIAQSGFERPGYVVMQLLEQALRGVRIGARMATDTFDAPRVGGSAFAANLPLVAALATKDGDTLRLMLINKDRSRTAEGSVVLAGTAGSRVAHTSLTTLAAAQPVRAPDAPDGFHRSERKWQPEGGKIEISLPHASLSLLTLTLKK